MPGSLVVILCLVEGLFGIGGRRWGKTVIDFILRVVLVVIIYNHLPNINIRVLDNCVPPGVRCSGGFMDLLLWVWCGRARGTAWCTTEVEW